MASASLHVAGREREKERKRKQADEVRVKVQLEKGMKRLRYICRIKWNGCFFHLDTGQMQVQEIETIGWKKTMKKKKTKKKWGSGCKEETHKTETLQEIVQHPCLVESPPPTTSLGSPRNLLSVFDGEGGQALGLA